MSLRGIAIETFKLPAFTPLARYAYGRFFERQRKGNHYQGVYPSHADALRAVPTTLRSSYDNEDAAARYRERTTQLTISDYPVLYWLSRLFDEGQRQIFDLEAMARMGYHVVDSWLSEERVCHVPFARDHDVESYSGFYLRHEANDGLPTVDR